MEPGTSKPASDASVASDSSDWMATESLGTSDRQKLEEWSFDQVWKLQDFWTFSAYEILVLRARLHGCTQIYYISTATKGHQKDEESKSFEIADSV